MFGSTLRTILMDLLRRYLRRRSAARRSSLPSTSSSTSDDSIAAAAASSLAVSTRPHLSKLRGVAYTAYFSGTR